jgi:hypothetical protein
MENEFESRIHALNNERAEVHHTIEERDLREAEAAESQLDVLIPQLTRLLRTHNTPLVTLYTRDTKFVGGIRDALPSGTLISPKRIETFKPMAEGWIVNIIKESDERSSWESYRTGITRAGSIFFTQGYSEKGYTDTPSPTFLGRIFGYKVVNHPGPGAILRHFADPVSALNALNDPTTTEYLSKYVR